MAGTLAAIVPIFLGVCFSSFALVHCVSQYDTFSSRELLPEYPQNQIEDEVKYIPMSTDEDRLDYDWSPPNGELPDSNLNAADSLTSYFGNGDDSQTLRESWLNDLGEKVPKNDLKRSFEFPKQKKNQVLCRVQRAIHHHGEAGYEFFPKSYTSYSCHPVVGPSQFEGALSTSHDVCLVKSSKCSTLNMKRFFLKRNHTNLCWSNVVSMDVGSGCDCLYHYKYRIHL